MPRDPPQSAKELLERYEKGARQFAGAELINADLSGAKLSGAKLFGAFLRGAELRNATYDEETVFPLGFNPTSRGMKLE